MSDTDKPADPAAAVPAIGEVRYSLPHILKELEVERAAGSFSTEKLDQVEIGKLFKNRAPTRRAKSKK